MSYNCNIFFKPYFDNEKSVKKVDIQLNNGRKRRHDVIVLSSVSIVCRRYAHFVRLVKEFRPKRLLFL